MFKNASKHYMRQECIEMQIKTHPFLTLAQVIILWSLATVYLFRIRNGVDTLSCSEFCGEDKRRLNAEASRTTIFN
jgi:hypothetical protein